MKSLPFLDGPHRSVRRISRLRRAARRLWSDLLRFLTQPSPF